MAPSTLRFLAGVGSSVLSTDGQPTVAAPIDIALEEYRLLAPHTSAAHVFSWWPAREPPPLRAGEAAALRA